MWIGLGKTKLEMRRKLIISNLILLLAILFMIFRYKVPPGIYQMLFGKPVDYSLTSCSYELGRFDFHYKPEPANPKIVMFGNSIIRRADWQKLLDRADVSNLGISGDRTICMCDRLQYLRGKNAKFWFIEGGINDLPYATTDSIFRNYQRIVAFVKDEGAIPVINLVFYTAPVLPRKRLARVHDPGLRDSITVLNSKLKAFARSNKLDVIDLNPVIADRNKVMKKEFSDDGLHLNEAGYREWVKLINAVLDKYEDES